MRSPSSQTQIAVDFTFSEENYREQARDRRVNRELRAAGWNVVRIWEHELARKREARLLAKLRRHGMISRGKPRGNE